MHFLILSPASSFAADVKTLLSDAQTAANKGEFKEAEIHLKNGLQDHPDNSKLRVALAMNYIAMGKGKFAAQELNKVISLGVDKSNLQIPLTKAMLMQGKADKIINSINDIIGQSKTNLAILRALQGRAYLHKNKRASANKLFLRAYTMAPEAMEVQISMAIMYSMQANTEKSRLLIEPLYFKHPYNVDILILKGNLLRFDKQYEQAITVFKTIKKIQPNNLTAWLGHINSLISLQDHAQASDLIIQLIELYPEYEEGHRLQAIMAFQLKDFAKAHNAIINIENINPDNTSILLLGAAVSFHLHNYERAEKKLNAYLKVDPGNLTATKILAEVKLNSNQPDKALEILLPFKDEEDGALKVLLATAYNLLGNSEKGLYYLNQASELLNNNQQIKQQLNYSKLISGHSINLVDGEASLDNFTEKELVQVAVYLKTRQFDKALKILKAYSNKDNKDPVIEYFLGVVYLQKKELDKAEIHLRNAHALNNQFISPINELALLYIEKGNIDEARRQYRKILSLQGDNIEALLGMGKLSKQENNKERMLFWFNSARKQNTYAIEPRILLNSYYFSHKQFNNALSITDELIEAYPDRVAFIELHALNLLVSKDYYLAISYLKKLINSPKADKSTIRQRLAIAQFMINDYDNSKQNFKKILILEPNNLVAQDFLLKLAIKNNDYNEAINIARTLNHAYPDKGIGEEFLGDIWAAQKDYVKTVKHYKKAINKQQKSNVLIKLFYAYLKQKNDQQAVAVMENWLKKHSKDIRVRSILAFYYHKTRNLQLAQHHYEIIVEQNSSNVSAINNLALIYDQLNDLRSIDYAELAFSLAPDSPTINDTLGWILLKNGDYKRAVERLKYASENAPADSDIMYHYAVALVKTGDKALALRKLYSFVPLKNSYENKNKAESLLKQLEKEKGKHNEVTK